MTSQDGVPAKITSRPYKERKLWVLEIKILQWVPHSSINPLCQHHMGKPREENLIKTSLAHNINEDRRGVAPSLSIVAQFRYLLFDLQEVHQVAFTNLFVCSFNIAQIRSSSGILRLIRVSILVGMG